MKILIAGGSGFIGQAIISKLIEEGHDCSVLSRRPTGDKHYVTYAWNPRKNQIDKDGLVNKDIVINLAGANLAEKFWTKKRKRVLYNSRITATRFLISEIEKLEKKPQKIISASAIGFYGNRPDEFLDESSNKGTGFLSDLCSDWEKSARTNRPEISTAIIRIGIVLSDAGGSLPVFKKPFKLGFNVLFGRGKHYLSWIHIDDLVNALLKIIKDEKAVGVFNLTAPNPVSQEEFNKVLGRSMKKKTLALGIPKWPVKLILGDMSEIILTDSRVIPGKLKEMKFEFGFPDLNTALKNLHLH